MTIDRRNLLRYAAGLPLQRALATGGVLAAGSSIAASAYPDRPVTLVVPQPPGGDADAVCRLLQGRIQEVLGQPLIIDNRPGAAGNLGVSYGLKAPADGYTVTFVNQGIVAINPTLYKNTGFRLDTMEPVTALTSTDLLFCSHPSLGVKTLRDFVALAKQAPGKYTYGTAGNGSANHVAAKLLESLAGIQMVHVPYKGGAPAIVDAIGGQLNLVVAFPLAALPHVKAGKLVALATTGTKRSSALPEVPTVAECGVSGYEFASWFGLVVPKGTPEPAIAKLNLAASEALKQPTTVDRLRASLTEPIAAGPKAFAALMESESRRWPPLLKQYDIRME